MKKLFLISFFVLLHTLCFCAARFWVGGGSSGNWNATAPTNWAATSGGANNQSVPTISDDVTFDGAGASGNTSCTITGADASCLSLTFTTAYTATITITTNRTLTVAGNFTDQTQHTWVVNSALAGALTISAASTITSNGKTFPGNVTTNGTSITRTLSGNWSISGTFTNNGSGAVFNSNTLNLSGGFSSTATMSGTTVLNFTGGAVSSSQAVSNSVNITGSPALGAYNVGGGTYTYVSGTPTFTGTLTISGATTFNTNGMTWNSVTTTSGTFTITLNSLFSASGTFTIAGAPTFAGTAGFSVGTLSCTQTGASTVTFKNGITYTITASFQAFTSRTGAIVSFTSDDGTLTAALTLSVGAVCSVLANFTRIDASGGRTINTFHGTLIGTTNIFSYTDYGGGISSSYLFCN